MIDILLIFQFLAPVQCWTQAIKKLLRSEFGFNKLIIKSADSSLDWVFNYTFWHNFEWKIWNYNYYFSKWFFLFFPPSHFICYHHSPVFQKKQTHFDYSDNFLANTFSFSPSLSFKTKIITPQHQEVIFWPYHVQEPMTFLYNLSVLTLKILLNGTHFPSHNLFHVVINPFPIIIFSFSASQISLITRQDPGLVFAATAGPMASGLFRRPAVGVHLG